MKRIAIIGGGISGLSAAFFLEQQRRAGAPLEYVLFEASPRLGGVIRTERVDGCVVEGGPDSFLTEKPWAAELCRQLGIEDQLIGSNDAQRKTYILVNGKLIPIPDGLAFMVPTKILPVAFSPLFSAGTKLQMAREWFHPRRSVKEDESVGSFVERHYGRQMVDRLADPLLSGVYGGEADQLSLHAVLPRFAEMQAQHGSLSKAVIENRKKARTIAEESPRSLFTSLKGGMQQLVDAILVLVPEAFLRPNTSVQSLHIEDDKWLVGSNANANAEGEAFDSVIIAIPACAAAKLLDANPSKLADELRHIRYSSSVTVFLGYDQSVRQQLPAGFGFLVPRSEGRRILAATFVHNKFPNRAPEDRAILRCFLGGTRDELVEDLSDPEIVKIVQREICEILGIAAEPLFTRAYKWKNAMAQYNVGHLERIERIKSLIHQSPRLFLAGNAYGGIGIPDCVRSGQEAARDALTALGLAK